MCPFIGQRQRHSKGKVVGLMWPCVACEWIINGEGCFPSAGTKYLTYTAQRTEGSFGSVSACDRVAPRQKVMVEAVMEQSCQIPGQNAEKVGKSQKKEQGPDTVPRVTSL